MVKIIEPQEWGSFLDGFTERNRGRRARYEVFSRGNVMEEDEEACFESASTDGNSVTIKRTHPGKGWEAEIVDELENIRGISVPYNTDNSEDALEFTNERNELTSLRLESRVDGES
jgi:hypothetical protein